MNYSTSPFYTTCTDLFDIWWIFQEKNQQSKLNEKIHELNFSWATHQNTTFDKEKLLDKESLLDTLNALYVSGNISDKDYRMWFELNCKTRI